MGYRKITIEKEGKEIVIGVTPTLLNGIWNIVGRDGEDKALKNIGLRILACHDYSKPLESEYLFTSEDSETSLDRMLDWLQRNRL